jgi:hypothetical protein
VSWVTSVHVEGVPLNELAVENVRLYPRRAR